MENEIIYTLKKISLNETNEALHVLGGYIVGATLVRSDFESLRNQYPLLDTIAELGADLETLEESEYAKPVFEEFQRTLIEFEQSLATSSNK